MSIKRFLGAAAVFLALTVFYGNVASASSVYRSAEESSVQTIASGMANKTVRGVANITTGWLEIPKQISCRFARMVRCRGFLSAR